MTHLYWSLGIGIAVFVVLLGVQRLMKGRKELRSGYVIVRADILGPHFLTIWKAVGDE